MAKKAGHTTIRNQNLFCLNCGGEYQLVYPIGIPDMNRKIKAFNELHADCKKTWQEPTMPLTEDIKKRMAFWLMKGERGLSSEVIFENMCDFKFKGAKHHPHDPDDFSRCYKLLELIPEWKAELHKLKTISPVWEKLVDNWDVLTQQYKELVETKKDNGMYEFMKTLGC